MRPTRTDVAKLAGVSTATVSNVLNRPDIVTEETAERVRAAIKQLGYRPDMIARSLSTKRTMQIGIVLEDMLNPYFGAIVKEFESAANEQNYFVNVCTGLNRLDNYLDDFITRGLEGIFITALPYKFHVEKLYNLVEKGIKIITSGNINADSRLVSSIENDYIAAMHDVIEHLYNLGHINIAYLSGLGRELTYDLRCNGYRKSLEEFNLPYRDSLLIDGEYPYSTNIKAGYDCAMRLMGTGEKFTAVICGNDLMALGAMKAFQEKGFKIPEDISVVGFDGIEIGRYWEPALTTMSVDKTKFGRKAFELLHSNILTGKTDQFISKLTLWEGGSTAVARKQS
ncbi:MAG TPA: LacI family transcriptional regulator [Clostridiales bacterium]|nr:LacI family transcriptional regulator [Clostridiales bacterium]